MLQPVGHPPEVMNKSDKNAVKARRMLQAMMDAEEPKIVETLKARLRV